MKKVDFFIVGAPKCATTSLHKYLDRHDDICMSQPKETNFFSFQEVSEQGLYYKERSITTPEGYEDAFHAAQDHQILGEASVSYLFYQAAAQKIHQYNHDAKIIVVLRDPVKRAISHYSMDKRLGYCDRTIESIFYDSQSGDLHFQQYFLLGNYYAQLQHYFNLFDAKHIKVILDTQIYADFDSVVNDLCQFLSIPIQDALHTGTQHNKAIVGKSALIAWLYRYGPLRRGIQKYMPRGLSQQLKQRLFKPEIKPRLSAVFAQHLYDYYLDDVCALEELIHIDLSDWKADDLAAEGEWF